MFILSFTIVKHNSNEGHLICNISDLLIRIDTIQYTSPNSEAVSVKVVSSRNGEVEDRRVVKSGDGILLTKRGVKAAHISRNIFTGKVYCIKEFHKNV